METKTVTYLILGIAAVFFIAVFIHMVKTTEPPEEIPEEVRARYGEIENKISQYPGVSSVTLNDFQGQVSIAVEVKPFYTREFCQQMGDNAVRLCTSMLSFHGLENGPQKDIGETQYKYRVVVAGQQKFIGKKDKKDKNLRW